MKSKIKTNKLKEFYKPGIYKAFITFLFLYMTYSIVVGSTITKYCLDHNIDFWKCNFSALDPTLKMQLIVGMVLAFVVIYSIACAFSIIRNRIWKVLFNK
jgi:hypothetical protein